MEKNKKSLGSKSKRKIKQKLLAMDSHCAYCGKELTLETSTLDHIIPKSKFIGANPNFIGNLVLACLACNKKKDDKIIKYYRSPI